MRLAAYIRTSTAEQALSMSEQRRRCTAYCAARGAELGGVYIDEGVSGKTPFAARPAGADLLADRADLDGVVSVRLDRLFRNTADCLLTLPAWTASGLDVHLVELGGQSLDTSSAVGRLFLSMLAAFAAFERDLISDRTTAALAELRAQGKRAGHVPFGFELESDGRTLVPCPSEQATQVHVRKMRADGATWRVCAADLNKRGVCRRNGRPWHRKAVRRCCGNDIQRKSAAG